MEPIESKSKYFSLLIWPYLGQGNATKKTSEKKWTLAQEGLDLKDNAKRPKCISNRLAKPSVSFFFSEIFEGRFVPIHYLRDAECLAKLAAHEKELESSHVKTRSLLDILRFFHRVSKRLVCF